MGLLGGDMLGISPVQSVNGRTGAVVLTPDDISGAEKTANKNAASGYMGLDSSTKATQAQLGTGTAGTTKFLRGGAGTQAAWDAIAVGDVSGAEATANKNAASGYMGLDSSTKATQAQLGTGTAGTTKFLRGGAGTQAAWDAIVVGDVSGAEATANKDAASGYMGLDSSTKATQAQLGTGTAGTTKFLRGGAGTQAAWDTIVSGDVSGLGTMATQAASAVNITGGSVTGITDMAIADGGTGASTASGARSNLGVSTKVLPIIIDGGGAVITTGTKCEIPFDFACTLSGIIMLGDATGSITIDLQKTTYTNYDASFSSMCTGGSKPAISSAKKSKPSTSGWSTTTVSADDVIRVIVDSASTLTRCTLYLTFTLT